MSKGIHLSVIIPTKNEGKRLGKNLDEYIEYLKKQNYTSEIVISDGNSTDNTKEVALKRKDVYPGLRFESDKNDKGGSKGLGIKAGMEIAEGDLKMFIDADGATKIKELDHALPWFKEGYDVVIGSRFLHDSKIHNEVKRVWYRELMGRMANLAIQILAVRGIKDTQCGFKIFSKKASDDIFKLLITGGWGFDMEVLTIAKKLGYKIKEVPVEWHEVGGGNISYKAYIQSLKDLFKIKWYKTTGRYSKRRLARVENATVS